MRSGRRASVPGWATWLLALDRAVITAHRGFDIVRDEVLFGFLPPAAFGALTERAYEGKSSYLPGNELHLLGLYDWELAVIGHPPFPAAGRILVGGIGGGRELPGLLARGYEVVAFEPNEILVQGAIETAAGDPKARVVCASYADLVDAVNGRGGPLEPALREPFDAVILGWGSLAHLLVEEDRLALFRAVRKLAPAAPVLMSFFVQQPPPDTRALRARLALRGLLTRIGRPAPPEGLEFCSVGFTMSFSKEQLFELAAATGYRVSRFEEADFAHAVFVPDAEPLRARDGNAKRQA